MHFRRLRMEPLEDRRLLATFTVSSLMDGAVTAAGQRPGTLRQAIFDANASPGADEIVFGSTTGTLNMSAGEFSIIEGLTISGSGRDSLTINAQDLSRIFSFSTTSITNRNLTIQDLTLRNGRPTTGPGGAVRFLGSGTLTLIDSTFSDSSTIANGAHGGGIYSQNKLTLTNCIVTRNDTEGSNASGGGIYADGDLQTIDSVIRENTSRGAGGGVRVLGVATVTNSAIIANSTSGPSAAGGGIHGFQDITIENSTISGNHTTGQDAEGGGILAIRDLEISHSTITDNHTAGSSAPGGGIAVLAASGTRNVSIHDSIIADNAATAGGIDLVGLGAGTVAMTSSYSLIGSTNGFTAAQIVSLNSGPGNLVNVDPLLAPLQNNGGNTPTHALLPGSPAINAGEPTLVDGVNGVPLTDQRGSGFTRVWGGRIDIGAFELQPPPNGPIADFDADDDIDGRDFLAWQRGYGKPNAMKSQGDADGDMDVDATDLSFWEGQYKLGVVISTGDFDSDGDIDGRDFLAWQRGYGAAYDATDLAAWRARYGTEGLSTIGSQFSSLGFEEGATAGLSSSFDDDAEELLIEKPHFFELAIDEAFDGWSLPTQSLARDFGDIVVCRSLKPRTVTI